MKVNLSSEDWEKLTNEMTSEEFKTLNPFIKKNCSNCIHLKAAISLWCTNEDAKTARGTSIPAVSNCPFWEVDWNQVDEKYKTVENGFIEKKEPIVKQEQKRTFLKRWFPFL